MQINIHIPRSEIRAYKAAVQHYDDDGMDPIEIAVTNAFGAPAFVGITHGRIPVLDQMFKVPRSLRRAIAKLDGNKLDAPVRFRLTIPDEVK